ncbi:MAG: phosphotransferase [Nannocystaceae bacterium]
MEGSVENPAENPTEMDAPLLSGEELGAVLQWLGLSRAEGEVVRRVSPRLLCLPRTGGGLAVKVFEAGQGSAAQAEALLLRYLGADRGDLRGAGYRVPQLVSSAAGDPTLVLGERRVLVTRWVEGTHRAYRDIDADGWSELGQTLAALHARLDDAPALPLPSLGGQLRSRSLEAERQTLLQHERLVQGSNDEGAAVLRSMLADRRVLLERYVPRSLAAPPPDVERPIHNDYNVHNYLFDDSGPPIILDWERAMLAPREYEVCRCLNHLPLVAPRVAWAFVQGYLRRRSLDPEHIDWALHAAVGTHALKHWPVEAWLRREPGAAARLGGMAEIVRAFVEGADGLRSFADELRGRLRDRVRDGVPQ